MRYQVDGGSSDHVFYAALSSSSSNELMRITGDGKVGISNSSPATAMDIDGGLTLRQSGTITISSDNQSVTVGNRTFLRIQASGGIGTNRSINLTNGLATGQLLIIEGVGGDSFEIQSDDNVRLNSVDLNLLLNSHDTMMLIWDGTYWVEISRSNNEN